MPAVDGDIATLRWPCETAQTHTRNHQAKAGSGSTVEARVIEAFKSADGSMVCDFHAQCGILELCPSHISFLISRVTSCSTPGLTLGVTQSACGGRKGYKGWSRIEESRDRLYAGSAYGTGTGVRATISRAKSSAGILGFVGHNRTDQHYLWSRRWAAARTAV